MLDIMMPFYGDPGLMKDAVVSVMSQRDDRWRLTVVDDDPRLDRVSDWFAQLGHPQIRYITNEQNVGCTRNFQRCVELAEYEHMTMIGCDDRLLPNYVGVLHDVWEAIPDASMVQPGVEVIDMQGQIHIPLADRVKRHYSPSGDGLIVMQGQSLATSLLRGNWLYFPSLGWRTADIASVGFDVNLHTIQDLRLIVTLVMRGAVLAVSPEVCFQYRRHPSSLSSITAGDGTRIREAGEFFSSTAYELDENGWTTASRVARRHWSSRAFALSLLPGAALRGEESFRDLVTHVFT